MNFQLRKKIILERIEKDGFFSIKELAVLLETSEITARRDIATLADQGLLLRTHGGAMKIGFDQAPINFAKKAAVQVEQKTAICQTAAGLVRKGEVVFLDCGSTVFQLCPFIRNLQIKVVTNSLPIVNELVGSSVSLNFVGGEIDPERQAAHGNMAVEHIRRYRADKAFVGVDGISLKNGLSALSEREAATTTAFVENAREAWFLCDSSKLEQDRYFPFAPIGFVKNLITDKSAEGAVLKKYKAKGMNVLC